jgi:hypothetical protein
MKVAIVATLIAAENVIQSFIDYHLKTGFSHLYLFFDDANDKTINQVQHIKHVTVIPCDNTLRSKWLKTNSYAAYGHLSTFIETEPMARQILNMDVACEMAKQDGMDWILHIDIDELFYSPHQTLEHHFNTLASSGVYYRRYLNYEAVPEKETIDDYFKEVTLFKKNQARYTPSEASNHSKHVGKDLFNYYKIGKMAARLDKIYLSGIHEFVFEKTEIGKPLPLGSPEPDDPIILHYVCCGFSHFQNKYTILGNFNPKAFGRQLYAAYEKSQAVTRQQNNELAKAFYRDAIMLAPDKIEQLLTFGLLNRITAPAHLLNSATSTL